MRLPARIALFLLAAAACAAGRTVLTFHVAGGAQGGWANILTSIGLQPAEEAEADVIVVRGGAKGSEWVARADQGAIVVLEGASAAAEEFGFRSGSRRLLVRSVEDRRRPSLSIIWEPPLEAPVVELPGAAQVFSRERREGIPLMAGFRQGKGAVLWVAADPGAGGHERFPYLLQALADLGLRPPFRSSRLWAFFDPAYRSRVDLDYFARRWREAGIAALHVAAWPYFEPDPARDQYLAKLIEACHRRSILVYAWLELPHVSEQFWREHPEWREKTALLQDAHLDWRKLINLNDRDCFQAVARGVGRLIERFDWDGVNLAELYFESLEGHSNPARFTPMNEVVRREFHGLRGFDPLLLFDPGSAAYHGRNPDGLRAFLDYRANLARRMQEEWLAEIETVRVGKPGLDLVLTHVDDRFDTRMRDLIGADAKELLPLLDRHDFTFLVEDPATIWHLGPERYPEIARRYGALTARTDKLAVDINIVERYQDVYPTKQQTGVELLRLVHLASQAFPRVALYFENSIAAPDLGLLPGAAATVSRAGRIGDKLVVESSRGVGVSWSGPARVNEALWPFTDGTTVWLPPGTHSVEPAPREPPLRLLDFSGELESALVIEQGLEFVYRSAGRAFAALNRAPGKVEVDGKITDAGKSKALVLPPGHHRVRIAQFPGGGGGGGGVAPESPGLPVGGGGGGGVAPVSPGSGGPPVPPVPVGTRGEPPEPDEGPRSRME